DGIALDVAAATEQVSAALDGRTFETALPAVADETVPAMAVVDVSPQQPSHQCRQLPGIVELQEQVEVVGHQTVMVEPECESLSIACDQGEEGAVIFIVAEDCLSVVPPIHQVVASLLGPLIATWHSWHGKPPWRVAHGLHKLRAILF